MLVAGGRARCRWPLFGLGSGRILFDCSRGFLWSRFRRFAVGTRVKLRKHVEVYAGRAVGGLEIRLVSGGSRLERLAGQPGLQEAAGVLEVSHKVDGAITLPIHPQTDGHGAGLV